MTGEETVVARLALRLRGEVALLKRYHVLNSSVPTISRSLQRSDLLLAHELHGVVRRGAVDAGVVI